MLLSLLASLPAHAVPEPFCSGLLLVDSVPSAGATDVPVDTRVALVFGDGGCGSTTGWEAELRIAESAKVGELLHENDPSDDWMLVLDHEEPLSPDTDYVVTATSPDGEEVAFGFRTGSGTVAGITGTPTFTVDATRWNPEAERSFSGLVGADLTLTPAADPDGLSVIQVQDPDAFEEGIRSFRVPAEGTRTVSVRWMTGVAPDQVCPQIRQIDGLGVATEWSERVCADVESEEVAACATTSGASLGALVLAGLLGLARRRAG